MLLLLLLLLCIMCIIPSMSPTVPAVWGQSSAVQSPADQNRHSFPLLPFGEPDKGGRGQVMNIVRHTQKRQWNKGPHCANNQVLHIRTLTCNECYSLPFPFPLPPHPPSPPLPHACAPSPPTGRPLYCSGGSATALTLFVGVLYVVNVYWH